MNLNCGIWHNLICCRAAHIICHSEERWGAQDCFLSEVATSSLESLLEHIYDADTGSGTHRLNMRGIVECARELGGAGGGVVGLWRPGLQSAR